MAVYMKFSDGEKVVYFAGQSEDAIRDDARDLDFNPEEGVIVSEEEARALEFEDVNFDGIEDGLQEFPSMILGSPVS